VQIDRTLPSLTWEKKYGRAPSIVLDKSVDADCSCPDRPQKCCGAGWPDGCGVAVAFAPTASAAPTPVSQATGRFLSGSIGGTDLDNLVAVKGEAAANNGGDAVTNQHSLNATLLNTQLLNLPNGIQLPGGAVIKLGAVNQFAQANKTGSAHGASGAVTNSGAIGLGEEAGSPQNDATIDLTNTPLASIAGLKLSVGAVAATADQATARAGPRPDLPAGRPQARAQQPDPGQRGQDADRWLQHRPGLSDQITKLGWRRPEHRPAAERQHEQLDQADEQRARIARRHQRRRRCDYRQPDRWHVDHRRRQAAEDGAQPRSEQPAAEHAPARIRRAGAAKALSNGLAELKKQLTSLFDKLSLNLNGVLPASGGQATSALDELLAPLTKALDSGASSLSNMVLVPLAKAAEKLVDVIVNVQENSNGLFTERALRVDLIGDPLARLNLASASVGPAPARPALPRRRRRRVRAPAHRTRRVPAGLAWPTPARAGRPRPDCSACSPCASVARWSARPSAFAGSASTTPNLS